MKRYLHTVMPALLVSLLWLSGCSHKEILCPSDGMRTVEVRFSWELASEASPEGMTVYFFPVSQGARIWRFDIPGREGGHVELPPGTYRLLAVNNDLPGITFTSQESFGAFAARARSARSADLLGSTGMLYGCTVGNVEVTVCGVTYTSSDGAAKECPLGVIRCRPDSLSTVYRIELRDCRGLENVRSVTGRLQGVAPEFRVADRIPEGEPAASALTFTRAGSTLKGAVTGFGSPAGYPPRFTLILQVVRKDGSVIVKNIDVTAQVINSKNPRSVFIILEGLEIPDGDKPVDPGGDVGIEVGVDGWQVIDIELST